MVIEHHPLLAKAGLAALASNIFNAYRYPLDMLLEREICFRVAWQMPGQHLALIYDVSAEDSPQELRREDGKGIEVVFVMMRVNSHVFIV